MQVQESQAGLLALFPQQERWCVLIKLFLFQNSVAELKFACNRNTHGKQHLRNWTEMAPVWFISTTKTEISIIPPSHLRSLELVPIHPPLALSHCCLLFVVVYYMKSVRIAFICVWFHSAWFYGKYPYCFLSQFSSESSILLHEDAVILLVWTSAVFSLG